MNAFLDGRPTLSYSERTPGGAWREARLSTRYRAVCEARAALEEARARLAGTSPLVEEDLAVAAAVAGKRFAEAARRYNEALLRCPE